MEKAVLNPACHFDIDAVSRPGVRADGSPCRTLSLADQACLAEKSGIGQREIQQIALEREVIPEIYSRNQNALGCLEQGRLLRSRAVVIGLGGLGGTVCELLARIGVGHLTLVDGDRFNESNLNRQLLSSVDVIGQAKATVAVARLGRINPAIEIRGVEQFLNKENAAEMIVGADVVVDCLDSIVTRLLLEQACETSGVPLVSAAVGGTAGQVLVVYPGERGLSRLYRGHASATTGTETVSGTLPFTVFALAAAQCAEAVAVMLGRAPALRNRVLLVDTASHESFITDLPEGE